MKEEFLEGGTGMSGLRSATLKILMPDTLQERVGPAEGRQRP